MNPMNIFTHYGAEITAIAEKLARDGKIPLDEIPPAYCEPPRDSSHGELSTNYALIMARPAKMPPKELAEILAKAIGEIKGIANVEVAGAGFINMTLKPQKWQECISDILKTKETKETWGENNIGKGQSINVEYVSANPTGPLHVAHARGGIVGDSLANLLEKSGYKVTREYYVNDAGRQVDILARAVCTHYLKLFGHKRLRVESGGYTGEYVKDIAKKLKNRHDDEFYNVDRYAIRDFVIEYIMRSIVKHFPKTATENVAQKFVFDIEKRRISEDVDLTRSAITFASEYLKRIFKRFPEHNESDINDIIQEILDDLELAIGNRLRDEICHEHLSKIRDFAIEDVMQGIEKDLARLDIKIDRDRFFSERKLVEGGAVGKAVEALKKKDLIYRGKPEKPKSDKAEDWESRKQMLFKSTKFGDDVDRTLQKSDGSLTYFATDIAYHLDKLEREGDNTTLINIWGADHGGYVKRLKAALEALTGRKDSLNVQLVQMVRLMDKGKPIKMSKRAGNFIALSKVLQNVDPNILRFIMLTRRSDQPLDFDYAKVKEQSRENPVFYVQYAYTRAWSVLSKKRGEYPENLTELTDESEIQLIRHLASFPREVEAAAKNFEPHRIAFYLIELAGLFHALWNRLRFLGVEADLEDARLQLVEATAIVLQNGLGILGVSAPKEM